jgi:hypothetical protein
MFLIFCLSGFAGAGNTARDCPAGLKGGDALPNCIYTRGGEYANCNHKSSEKHFKEVTHEKDIQCDPI